MANVFKSLDILLGHRKLAYCLLHGDEMNDAYCTLAGLSLQTSHVNII